MTQPIPDGRNNFERGAYGIYGDMGRYVSPRQLFAGNLSGHFCGNFKP